MNRYVLMPIMLAAVSSADAQIPRRTVLVTEPSTWLSVSTGLYGANGVNDGATASDWNFGAGTDWQLRIAVEQTLQNQFALGGVLTYVNVPFVYTGPSCGRCDAHLDLTSLGVSFHAGGGLGLHQVLEASAGAAFYQRLKRDSDGQTLEPRDGNVDPFFTFGYGFGYTFNKAMELSIVQDYGLVLHERTNLSNAQSNTLTQHTTRLSFRVGFGSQTRRR